VNVRLVRWQEAAPLLRVVRNAVFVQEFGIPADLEFDEVDPQCQHALALTDDGQPIGAGRLTPQGRIGRLAVLPAFRHKSVGTALLRALEQAARMQGHTQLFLHAQLENATFYARHGYVQQGAPFQECGLWHCQMEKVLPGI
jgi:predicted GNAT family N-acyltransferase